MHKDGRDTEYKRPKRLQITSYSKVYKDKSNYIFDSIQELSIVSIPNMN